MDQDFFKGIEASSMSVDDILREFHAQDAAIADTTPRRQESPPQRPAGKRPENTTPQRAQEPQRSSPAAALRSSWQRIAKPSLRQIRNMQSPFTKTRGQSAETENRMDFESEKEQRAVADPAEDQELLGILGGLFDQDASSPADSSDPAEPPVPEESAEQHTEDSLESISLEDIMAEYGKVFAEKPAEAIEEDARDTRFFTPKKQERREEEKASAEEYAAYAAGSSAVASSQAKISALSSMAEEALRYMSSLTDQDFDRMASEPASKPAPSKKDAGAERFNLAGHQEKMVFGDQELDLSPDESYVPPSQKTEPIYHWTAGEEDLPDVPEEPPTLLQRIMNFNGSRRKEKKKPLNAPGKRARDAFPAAAPAEAKPDAAETDATPAAVTDDTVVFGTQPLEAESAPAAVTDETVVFDAQPKEAAGEKKRPAPSLEDFDLSFDDTIAAPAVYAPEKDYSPEEYEGENTEAEPDSEPDGPEGSTAEPVEEEAAAPEEEKKRFGKKARRRVEEEIPLDENGEFPSFPQYVASLITGTLYRLRGAGGDPGSVTMDTEGEDLGAELSPAEASKYYGSFVPSLRTRFRIGLALLAVLAWISLGLPVSGMLRTVRVAAGMCLGLQLVIMLLSLDVITNAAINMVRLRFGADFLVCLTCILTSFDALAVALDAFGTPHMPLCLLSSLSLMGVLCSSYLSARGLRKALRVPSIAKHLGTVTGEAAFKGKGITLLKTDRPITGFVRRMEEAAPDETIFLRAAPALLALCFLLAAVVSSVNHVGGDFLYVFTALLTPAVPVGALLCFALPFFIGSNRIFYSGAAVAGWSGLSDVGRSQNLIITDRDLFPEGSAEIDTVRIFADADPERILSYAGTMILASGSGIASCFAELMNRNGGTIRHVDNFEHLPGGGMKGIIDGSTVLCGGTELMRLMNVRIPFRLVDKTTVLLAVDGVLYGIFNMKYTGQPQVRKALVGLIRSSRHPVFAVRDFNVNPEMLHDIFDVATDGYDFPPYLERFKLSEAPEGSEAPVAAVICREGLGPLSQMADTGRNMYLVTRLNLIITLIAAVVGVFAVFIRFMNIGSVSILFLLLFALLWLLPVVAASLSLKI